MGRLTTDKDASDISMTQMAHNACYIKDGKARYRDYDMDIDARELVRELLKSHAGGDDAFTCDEDFDEQMVKYLMHGLDDMEGLIAAFYRNIWAMAEIHEWLRVYEELNEKGKLLELPCVAGDMVYGADKHGEIVPMEVTQIGAYSWKDGTAILITCWDGCNKERVDYTSGDFGERIFFSEEEVKEFLRIGRSRCAEMHREQNEQVSEKWKG